MGNYHSSSILLEGSNVEPLVSSSGRLTKAQLDRLERRMTRLGRGRSELARSDLIGIPGIQDSIFLDAIFRMYDTGRIGVG